MRDSDSASEFAVGRQAGRLARGAGDLAAIFFLATVAKREVQAIAFGPFTHRIVAHTELLGKGGPVTHVDHELVEFVGGGPGDFAWSVSSGGVSSVAGSALAASPAIDRNKGLHNVLDQAPDKYKFVFEQTAQFRRDLGTSVTESGLAGLDQPPDVIVAANDDMALGALLRGASA